MVASFHSLYLGVRHVFDSVLRVQTEDKATQIDQILESQESVRGNFHFLSVASQEGTSRSVESNCAVGLSKRPKRKRNKRKAAADQAVKHSDEMSGWGRGNQPQRGRGYGQNYQTQQPPGHSAHASQSFSGGRGFSTGLGRGYGGYTSANQPPVYYDQYQQQQPYIGAASNQQAWNQMAGQGRGFVTGMGRGMYGAGPWPAAVSHTQGYRGKRGHGRAKQKKPHSAGDAPETLLSSSSAHPHASPQTGVSTGLGRGFSPSQNSVRQQPAGAPSPGNAGAASTSMGDSRSGIGPGLSPSQDSMRQQSVVTQKLGYTAAALSMGGESSSDPKALNAPQARGLQRHLDRVNFSSDSDLGKFISCLQSLESLWFHHPGQPALSEKEKQSRSVKIVDKCLKDVENPWGAALYLTCTAKDYMTTKPSCLAYFCMRTFAKLPLFTSGKDGCPLDDYVTEARRIIAHFNLEALGGETAEWLIQSLAGPAKREINLHPPQATATADLVLNILQETFGDHASISTLLASFYSTCQSQEEGILSYAHSLQALQVKANAVVAGAVSDAALRDRFMHGLCLPEMRRDIMRFARGRVT